MEDEEKGEGLYQQKKTMRMQIDRCIFFNIEIFFEIVFEQVVLKQWNFQTPRVGIRFTYIKDVIPPPPIDCTDIQTRRFPL